MYENIKLLDKMFLLKNHEEIFIVIDQIEKTIKRL
jgi:hypothetical protein